MLKVYLETTIFNRFFEDNRDYNRETKELFGKIARNEIAAYSSQKWQLK
jgi:ribosomal protein S17E